MRFEPVLPDDSVNVSEGSVTREASILVVGVATGFLLLTAILALAIEVLVPWIPPSLEVRVFSALATGFETERNADGEAQESDPRGPSVQALLDRLALHWLDSPYPGFRAHVIDDPAPNAHALPGGVLIVTSGLLERIETENELAFVLGHELGHFAGRDHLRGLGRGLAITVAWAALGLGGGQIEHLAGVASAVSARHFDRTQESDADLFGLDLLAAEYGHTGGTAAVFERVLREPDPDPRSGDPDRLDRLGAALSTHPLGPDRIAALEAARALAGYRAQGSQVPWPSTPPIPPAEADRTPQR